MVEAKLSGGVVGRPQMEELYKPLLEHIHGRPFRCLLVCKYITEETPRPIFHSMEDFLRTGLPFGTWHFLG